MLSVLICAFSAGVGVDLKGGQYERFTGTGDGNITLRLGAGAIVEELRWLLG